MDDETSASSPNEEAEVADGVGIGWVAEIISLKPSIVVVLEIAVDEATEPENDVAEVEVKLKVNIEVFSAVVLAETLVTVLLWARELENEEGSSDELDEPLTVSSELALDELENLEVVLEDELNVLEEDEDGAENELEDEDDADDDEDSAEDDAEDE